MRSTQDAPRNRLRWLGRWGRDVEHAVDWACAQFPPEVQRRGVARGYYECLNVVHEIVRACPGGVAELRIADVGCGAGLYSLALTKLGARVTAIDWFVEYEPAFHNQMGDSREIVPRLERHGIEVLRRDIVADGLPSIENAYDVALFLHVIEHLHESPRSILAGLHRILRPGGIAAITTPNQGWIRTRARLLFGRSAYHPLPEWWATPFFGHVREYTLDELTAMLQWSGFDVRRTSISSWLHFASRVRGPAGMPDTWTTQFTLDTPERWLVAGSLLVTMLFPSLGYSMLAIARKPPLALGT